MSEFSTYDELVMLAGLNRKRLEFSVEQEAAMGCLNPNVTNVARLQLDVLSVIASRRWEHDTDEQPDIEPTPDDSGFNDIADELGASTGELKRLAGVSDE